jgi:hypothetical protein
MKQVNPKERVELIEVVVSNTGVKEFSLGQLPNLRTAKKIIAIEALRVTAVTNAPSGNAVVNEVVFKQAFIKLINSENVEYRALALASLSKAVNGTTIPELNTPPIDPEKSKIVVSGTAALVLNEVFLLEVTYEK